MVYVWSILCPEKWKRAPPAIIIRMENTKLFDNTYHCTCLYIRRCTSQAKNNIWQKQNIRQAVIAICLPCCNIAIHLRYCNNLQYIRRCACAMNQSHVYTMEVLFEYKESCCLLRSDSTSTEAMLDLILTEFKKYEPEARVVF